MYFLVYIKNLKVYAKEKDINISNTRKLLNEKGKNPVFKKMV